MVRAHSDENRETAGRELQLDLVEASLGAIVELAPRARVHTSTLEFLKVPADTVGRVQILRVAPLYALTIVDGESLEPGYSGCAPLIIENSGDAPVTLRVGARTFEMTLTSTSHEGTAAQHEDHPFPILGPAARVLLATGPP